MPMTSSTDNINYAFDDSSEKSNSAIVTNQAAKANDYSRCQQPSAPSAGAVGGTDNGNMEYEQCGMYQSLEDGASPEDPVEYEVIGPKRPIPRPK